MRLFLPLVAFLTTIAPAPALAAATSFVLVNGTDLSLTELGIRRFGTDQWRALKLSPAPGAQRPIEFDDPDCAFDIRATANGQQLVWTGVNLCEVKIVTLRRNARSGVLYVDYR